MFSVVTIFALIAALVPRGQEHVLELTSANFSATVDAPGARVLVQFYLPWCSYCKRLAPAYAAAAASVHKIASDDPTLVGRLARVDADAERSLATRHGAVGYPSLWWFADGTHGKEYLLSNATEGSALGPLAPEAPWRSWLDSVQAVELSTCS